MKNDGPIVSVLVGIWIWLMFICLILGALARKFGVRWLDLWGLS